MNPILGYAGRICFGSNTTVTPKDDLITKGSETVIVTQSSNPAYSVGSPGSATVTILDNN